MLFDIVTVQHLQLYNSSQHALNRLQRVMNAAARLVCHSGRLTPVSGLLRDRLHWLRVPEAASQVQALSSSLQSCSWHCTELPE